MRVFANKHWGTRMAHICVSLNRPKLNKHSAFRRSKTRSKNVFSLSCSKEENRNGHEYVELKLWCPSFFVLAHQQAIVSYMLQKYWICGSAEFFKVKPRFRIPITETLARF